MNDRFSNSHEIGQYNYFENSYECPSQWNQYDSSFDQQNQRFYNESFENSYDPNGYNYSDHFQDPNTCFQNFQNQETVFQTGPSLEDTLENFIQTTSSDSRNFQSHS